jgi:hypothetical protein
MTHPTLYRGLLYDFKPPEDQDAKIWRFMSFARYLWLLESRALFFARASSFEDTFEGAKTQATIEARERFPPRKRQRVLLGGSDMARDLTFINCWHMNNYESQGMWKLYVQGVEGVAIQSRFAILEKCLRENPREDDIYVGCVKYIDYEKEGMCDDWITPFIYKRHSFRHESEVRAIMFPRRRPACAVNREDLRPGVSVEINLDSLIQAVYVSPYAPPWLQTLTSTISERYGLRAPVRASDLRAEPIF